MIEIGFNKRETTDTWKKRKIKEINFTNKNNGKFYVTLICVFVSNMVNGLNIC